MENALESCWHILKAWRLIPELMGLILESWGLVLHKLRFVELRFNFIFGAVRPILEHETLPGATEAHTRAMRAHPGALKAHPGAMEFLP
jgi:hypothetical protein